jgi:hypothetical protein
MRAAAIELGADMVGQPLSGPERFVGVPQSGFDLRSCACLAHAFRKRRHLPRQRLEKLEIPGGHLYRVARGTECIHPLGCPRDRSSKAPAHNQQSDGDNHQYQTGDVDKDAAPDAENFCANVAGVIDDDDPAADAPIRRAQRRTEHVHPLEMQPHVAAYGLLAIQCLS